MEFHGAPPPPIVQNLYFPVVSQVFSARCSAAFSCGLEGSPGTT
jgi:hypothetical protein